MKNKLFVFFLFFSFAIFSQNVQLASAYFNKGAYEKAATIYQSLHDKNPVRRDYLKKLTTCYQQLDRYKEVDKLLRNQIKTFPTQTFIYIEIGYNYQLQKEDNKAKKYYDKALSQINQNPNYGFSMGQTFMQNNLLDYALQSYQTAKSLDPKLNTGFYEAQIYAEKGEINQMFHAYLTLLDKDQKYYTAIQRYIATFITEDSTNENNIILKKQLIKRAQNNPKDSWNILLSWLFMQQKEYNKALIQEKSLFQRNANGLDRILELGIVAMNNEDFETAKNTFLYILKQAENNNFNPELILQTKIYLIQIDEKLASNNSELAKIDIEYQKLLSEYGNTPQSIDLQLAYANYLTFQTNQPDKAIQILENTLELTNSKVKKGNIQIKLADVLVYNSQFNQALILYTQVQTENKNTPLAQKARFKIAQTSYFKGDFQWAKTQLKILKSSTSQLIANDALELHLFINNNTVKDSTQLALKTYAKADLLAYQKKYIQAIDTLNLVLTNFKGHAIEDDAFFKQAELYTQTHNYTAAESNYLKIIKNYPKSVLIDLVYFKLGNLYHENLDKPKKAKEMYQKIIFDYPSSIYLVAARKKYRLLRGDDINNL